jgi:hypothetical protein
VRLLQVWKSPDGEIRFGLPGWTPEGAASGWWPIGFFGLDLRDEQGREIPDAVEETLADSQGRSNRPITQVVEDYLEAIQGPTGSPS